MIQCKIFYNSNEEEINKFLKEQQGTFISLHQNIVTSSKDENNNPILTAPRLVTTILYNEPNLRGGLKVG